jgi:hypothetical protein
VLPVRYELNLYMLCRRKWKLGTNSAFAQGLRKTTENLSRETKENHGKR